MLSEFATWGTLAGSIATAIATIFLWRVTKLLAVETKRMADLAAQPQVVATIVPNKWSVIHLDIELENTGTATAFDIKVVFTPEIDLSKDEISKLKAPFSEVSIMKPGQKLVSYLKQTGDTMDMEFTVNVSWGIQPGAAERQEIVYNLSMKDYASVSYLGARDPLVQIAEQVKHIREDWRGAARAKPRG